MAGWCWRAGCEPGWCVELEMKGEDRVRHEESILCQGTQRQALAGAPPRMGLDLRDPGDARLAQKDARLQSCAAL